MRIGSPIFLFAGAAIPLVVALLVFAAHRRRSLLSEFGDWEPIARIQRSVDPRRRRTKAILFACGVALAVVALVRPQFGAREVVVKRRGIDVVFAIDTSLSMLARDLPPSRIERAKQEISRVLDRLGGDRVALVAFAGGAYVQCPFTLDYGALRLFLENVTVGTVPKVGSDVEAAIRRATNLLRSDEKKYKALVLFSDGEALSGDTERAVREAAEAGVRILAVGVGTPAGGVIPVVDEEGRSAGVKRDATGEVVVTRLDDVVLGEIARATGGSYIALGGPGDPGAEIAEAIASFEKKDVSSRTALQFEERHAWFSLAAFLLLLTELLLPGGRRARNARREAVA
jgi:Ca-activated chloride channel family protein